jgi:hypothetical protein
VADVTISAPELRKLRRDAAFGQQARKREAAVAALRRANREGNGQRERNHVHGLGAQTERLFREEAAKAGWAVSKRGWPDFILRRGGEVVFVEVKARAAKSLKPEQMEIAEMLAGAGFKVYRWSPEGGFVRIYAAPETRHAPGGSTTATEPATRGARQSRHPTPTRDGASQQAGNASGKTRLGQGTRTPQEAGP